MPVHVQTTEGTVTHQSGDKAHWTDARFLEVFSGDHTIGVHAPGTWLYFTVEKVDAAQLRSNLRDFLGIVADNDGTGV